MFWKENNPLIGDTAMTSTLTDADSVMTSRPFPIENLLSHPTQPLTKDELDAILRALEVPFAVNLVQWRVTEWNEAGTRGLMMPYADPRAYSDRLNGLFTPAGWTRKYTVQASAPVQRSRRGPAAKILVTCEVTIAGIGTNSGTGEEWSDKENALTGAEAQAFKRALSLFGLGRYLYDMDGEWIELDPQGVPESIPKLPRWATPKGWLAGLRPKPRRNRHAAIRAGGRSGIGDLANHPSNGNGGGLITEIEAMETKIGKRLYRGLLKRVARVWSPDQIHDVAVRQQVLAQMQGAERGIARLEAAQARLAPETVQRVIASLNAAPQKIEDLQTLHSLVVALEQEGDATTQP
jgi:Rad52/22 family double-strand break repair protein